jgi:hypothetical protein
MARAKEEAFNDLHRVVTEELTSRLMKGEECSTADIKAAIDWLAKNNITGVASGSSPLAQMLAALEVTDEEVERVIR